MPMFYTPKPHRFTYKPRFYDPEKEKWDALKQKYADEKKHLTEDNSEDDVSRHVAESTDDAGKTCTTDTATSEENKDLSYFEHRVRQLDSQDREEKSKLKFGDLFRKRSMPTFKYQSRFSNNGGTEQVEGGKNVDSEGQAIMQRMRKHKMSRRFDIEDEDYFKPISAGKIMFYALLATLLLLWILL